jgi:hypothetical protein
VRTFALPQGLWPKNRALATAGKWTNPRGGRTTEYRFDAVLEVSGSGAGVPHGAGFDPHAINRYQVIGDNLKNLLDRIEPTRYRVK